MDQLVAEFHATRVLGKADDLQNSQVAGTGAKQAKTVGCGRVIGWIRQNLISILGFCIGTHFLPQMQFP